MKKQKKSKEELEAENEHLRNSRLVEIIIPIATTTLRMGGLLGVTYITYLSVGEIAGMNTNANILLSVNASFFPKFFSDKLSLVAGALMTVFGIGGILYGVWERSLRMATVSHLQGRIKVSEKKIDPNRSSSMLTSKGETRPEDL